MLFRSGMGEIAKARKWSHSDKPPGDWKNIKDIQEIKLNQYVMILKNGTPDPVTREYDYVNGDCGWIQEIGLDGDNEVDWVKVRLARNDSSIIIGKVIRNNKVPELPYGYSERDIVKVGQRDRITYQEGVIQYDVIEKRYVDAQIEYLPIRPAYATSIHKCVAGDTRIPIMGEGLLPIREVTSEMMTPYGRIIATAKSNQVPFRIITARGYSVVTSKHHRWLTSTGLVETQNLKKGDRIELARAVPLPVSEKMPSDIAWLLGALVGDGNYSDAYEGQLHFSNIHKQLGDEYQRIIRSQGYRCEWRKDLRGLHSTSVPFRNYLRDLGLGFVTSHFKTIPEEVFLSGPSTWGEFLGGLFDTDGSVSAKRVCLTTVSESLADGVMLLLLKLGVASKKYTCPLKYKDSKESYYQIFIAPSNMERFFREVKLRHSEKLKTIKSFNISAYSRINRNFDGTDTIASVEKLSQKSSEKKIEMYDIELAEAHIFVNLVHSFGITPRG